MKKNKKIIFSLLIIVLLLTGCNDKENEKESNNKSIKRETVKAYEDDGFLFTFFSLKQIQERDIHGKCYKDGKETECEKYLKKDYESRIENNERFIFVQAHIDDYIIEYFTKDDTLYFERINDDYSKQDKYMIINEDNNKNVNIRRLSKTEDCYINIKGEISSDNKKCEEYDENEAIEIEKEYNKILKKYKINIEDLINVFKKFKNNDVENFIEELNDNYKSASYNEIKEKIDDDYAYSLRKTGPVVFVISKINDGINFSVKFDSKNNPESFMIFTSLTENVPGYLYDFNKDIGVVRFIGTECAYYPDSDKYEKCSESEIDEIHSFMFNVEYNLDRFRVTRDELKLFMVEYYKNN